MIHDYLNIQPIMQYMHTCNETILGWVYQLWQIVFKILFSKTYTIPPINEIGCMPRAWNKPSKREAYN